MNESTQPQADPVDDPLAIPGFLKRPAPVAAKAEPATSPEKPKAAKAATAKATTKADQVRRLREVRAATKGGGEPVTAPKPTTTKESAMRTQTTPKATTPKQKAASAKKTAKPTSDRRKKVARAGGGRKAAEKPKAAPRSGETKGDMVVKMLATWTPLKDVLKATGWQPHTARAFFSRLGKSVKDGGRGLTVEHERRDGEPYYRVGK